MQFACFSDIGLCREKNQDSYCAIENSFGDLLAIVADGIGGGKAGEVASGDVVEYCNEVFRNSGPFETAENVVSYIKFHLNKINEKIYYKSLSDTKYFGMGTTVTGIFINKNLSVVFNCGDSRVYGVAGDDLYRLTSDDTLINQMIEKGQVTREQALNHPKRHYLVKAIGIFKNVECDVHSVKDMDYYLICSDGIHGYISDDEIQSIVCQNFKTIEEKVEELKDIALLKGGYDNITVILIKK